MNNLSQLMNKKWAYPLSPNALDEFLNSGIGVSGASF